MKTDRQRVLVAQIAATLLAQAKAAGQGDEFTVGDLINTCLLDAAVIVASVQDDFRFDVLMSAAADTIAEMDECIPISGGAEAEDRAAACARDEDLPLALDAFGPLRRPN